MKLQDYYIHRGYEILSKEVDRLILKSPKAKIIVVKPFSFDIGEADLRRLDINELEREGDAIQIWVPPKLKKKAELIFKEPSIIIHDYGEIKYLDNVNIPSYEFQVATVDLEKADYEEFEPLPSLTIDLKENSNKNPEYNLQGLSNIIKEAVSKAIKEDAIFTLLLSRIEAIEKELKELSAVRPDISITNPVTFNRPVQRVVEEIHVEKNQDTADVKRKVNIGSRLDKIEIPEYVMKNPWVGIIKNKARKNV